jgi:hypothetical protein
MGTTLALPLLDSMVPAFSTVARAAGASPRRFSLIYVAHGSSPGYWVPKAEGAAYELTAPLQPLAKFKDRLLVLSGIDNEVAVQRPGDPRGGHGRMAPAFMCGVHARPTQGADFEAGISIDQIVANQIGHQTQVPSLQLSVEPVEMSGSCDSGYSCVYTNTLCWRGPTSPLPMEDNPRAAFERLFGDAGTTDPAVRARRLREKRSILDAVLEKAMGVRTSVGPSDRRQLEQYLEAIRDVERRIQNAEAQSDRELPRVMQPGPIPETFPEYAKLMLDLQVLAFQADITRVSTFMMAKEISGRTFPEIGVSEGHHALSHHGDNPEKMAQLAKVNAHHVSMLAHFVDRLQATPDGDGSLLDHSLILYGSGHGDPNKHDPHELPILIFGADQIKGGRHIRYSHAQLPNLHMTLLNRFGVPVEHVGVSTGQLEIDTLSGV